MKVVSKLSYYNLLTIALMASVNMTLKLLILNYCNDIFIAIKYHFEIFVGINCKNNWYQDIATISSFFKLLQ